MIRHPPLPSSAQAITGRRIRFALVGCGRISINHRKAIAQHGERAELIALCETDAHVRAAVAAETGLPAYASIEELLTNSDADAVILATPSGLHARQAIACAAAHRHVITEKPMATRWADGKAMVQACDAAGVRLFVVKQNRCNPTLQLLKKAIDEGRFGRLHLVTINVIWNRPQSYYDIAPWRGTWEFDGGAFMNQASHYVDLLDWLVGPVETVHAFTATRARDIETEDTGVAAIRWRSGCLGSINVTMLAHRKNLEGSITLIGDTGTVRIGGLAVNEIQHWDFATPHPDDDLIKDATYQTTSVYGFGHPLYYDNVISTLLGQAEPFTDGREGLRSLEVLVALYKSARDGRPTALPLEL